MRHSGDLLRPLRRPPGIEFHDGGAHPKSGRRLGRIVVDEEFGGE
jgi:hypothetical protein